MARIAGVNIPVNKRVEVGLTYVFGVGRSTASQIVKDTGISPDTKVKDLTGTQGYNAADDTYGEMLPAVPDAAKVTRSALQNAASIAALFLTTECVIADKPAESGAGGGMPGGGMEDV